MLTDGIDAGGLFFRNKKRFFHQCELGRQFFAGRLLRPDGQLDAAFVGAEKLKLHVAQAALDGSPMGVDVKRIIDALRSAIIPPAWRLQIGTFRAHWNRPTCIRHRGRSTTVDEITTNGAVL